jgi:hypothetical protein
MSETETIVLKDGTRVKLPQGLSDGEIENALAAAMPARMASMGITYSLDREYDTASGIEDAGIRFDAALARGNPKEITNVMDENFGENNWGITPNTTIPYVTPDGLRYAGMEPKDDRKVLLKGRTTSIYDIIDYSPEIAIGAASLATEIALPMLPGTGTVGAAGVRGVLSTLTGRGLVARSGAAGVGAGLGSLGIESIQYVRGGQKENAREIFNRAGTEAAIVGLGSLALGVPISVATGGASRAISAAKKMSPEMKPKPIKVADLEAQKEAVRKVSGYRDATGRWNKGVLEEDDAILLSLRTLVGEENTAAGQAIKIMEGLGARQMKEKFPAMLREAMEKYRAAIMASHSLDDVATVATIKQFLTKQEQELLVKAINNLEKFPKKLTAVDNAASTLSSMKKYIDERLLAQYRLGMAEFTGKYAAWNTGGVATIRVLNTNELAKYMNNVVKISEQNANDVLNAFESIGGLSNRLTPRLRITRNGKFAPAKISKKDIEKSKKDKDFNPYGARAGEDIKTDDLIRVDQKIRGAAFESNNRSIARTRTEVSKGTLDALEEYIPESASLQKFKNINSEYGKFVDLYRGKNGLFHRLGMDNPAVAADEYLQKFISGETKGEMEKMLSTLDKAFSKSAAGMRELERKNPELYKIQLEAKDNMLSSMGFHFIKESKARVKQRVDDAQSATEPGLRKVARDELERIHETQTILLNRLGSDKPKVNDAINKIFKKDSLKDYKDLLRIIATGQPKQAGNAIDRLNQIMSFKEAAEFTATTAHYGSSLSKAPIEDIISQLDRLGKLDTNAAAMYREMIFGENWSKVITSANLGSPERAITVLKDWADDYILAIGRSGDDNIAKIMPNMQLHQEMKNLAITVQGAAKVDPVSGALSTAEIIPSTIRALLRLDFKAAIKPLSYMFTTRQLAPGSKAWKALNERLMSQGSIDPAAIAKELASSNSSGRTAAAKAVNSAFEVGRKSASLALSGRNGLFAASVANYMEEAEDVYPGEYEIAVRTLAGQGYNENVPVENEPVIEEKPAPSLIPTDTGMAAIREIANMIQPSQTPIAGTGVSALEEGAAIAEKRV